jgi:hypothetical protein
MVKFEREDIQEILTSGTVELMITDKVDNETFAGFDTIKIIEEKEPKEKCEKKDKCKGKAKGRGGQCGKPDAPSGQAK